MNKYLKYFLCNLLLLFVSSGYSQSFSSDSLIPFRLGNNWGYSDLKGNIVIEPSYTSAAFFYKNRAIVQDKNTFYLIDPKNQKSSKDCQKIRLRTDCDYICYRALIKDKVETLDTNGNYYDLEWGPGCSEAMYGPRSEDDLIKSYSDLNVHSQYFKNDSQKVHYRLILPTNVDRNYFYVYTKTSTGLVYNNGKIINTILDTVYQKIIIYKSDKYEYIFVVKQNDMEALITKKETIIPFKYKSIIPDEMNKNMVLVETGNGKKGYVNFYGFEYFRD